jgi:amino acid permease
MVLKLFNLEGNFMTKKSFWIVIFASGLAPICVKKVVNDFKWVSYLLFAALTVFILCFAE